MCIDILHNRLKCIIIINIIIFVQGGSRLTLYSDSPHYTFNNYKLTAIRLLVVCLLIIC